MMGIEKNWPAEKVVKQCKQLLVSWTRELDKGERKGNCNH